MKHISLLKNSIQKYAWGSKTAIPEILGVSPDGDPQAELWMGTHPKAPSAVNQDGAWILLPELIDRTPVAILGKAVSDKYSGKLPFLFKVLAAEKPLSIQAHPDRILAREGFLRETSAGIEPDAPNRSYKDDNHKPECICALTPFWAMNGFRKIPSMLFYLNKICPDTLSEALTELKENQNSKGLKRFFQKLLQRSADDVFLTITEAVGRAEALQESDPVYRWIIRLYEKYPQDIGVLSPAILNLVCLEAGEAMYLSAGCLHGYLEGVGMELMANSDNVLRGGLTSKHIDVPELIKVLRFEETELDILKPLQETPGVKRYHTAAEEFMLSEISVGDGVFFESKTERSVEIMFCVKGTARIVEISSNYRMDISKGMSLIIPASVDRYRVEGSAVLYRASVAGQTT